MPRESKRLLAALLLASAELATGWRAGEAAGWLRSRVRASSPAVVATATTPGPAVSSIDLAAAAAPAAAPKLSTELLPPSAKSNWEVHKFGGASLSTAELYIQCGDLLIEESKRTLASTGALAPTMAIVSAKGGVTDKLINVVQAALSSLSEATGLLDAVVEEIAEVVRAIATPEVAAAVEARFDEDKRGIVAVLAAIAAMRTIPAVMFDLVAGYGEIWSAATLYSYLSKVTDASTWLDARDVLIVEQAAGAEGMGEKGSTNVVGTDPVWDVTSEKLKAWWTDPAQSFLADADCTKAAPIVVVTGFVASTAEGTPTTLKRSGSDYSATIFAKLVRASKITMWKNVNGVYTADPRRVPEAFPIASLKYEEANELAFFGAQVLHPSAMLPCIECSIPVYVRNMFNTSHPGTVIEGRACTLGTAAEAWCESTAEARNQLNSARSVVPRTVEEAPIRGITSIDNVAILNLEGTGTSAVPDLSQRLFNTLNKNNVKVLMVTQASSDSSVCIVLEEEVGERALAALEAEFERELQRGLVASINIEMSHSVVAIVGEGMAFRPGTAATFTKSMSTAGVNIRLIAQGSSERQISIVVEREDCTRALRAAHAALALSNTQLSVAIIGASGSVGSEVLRQMVESNRVSDDPRAASARQVLDDLRLDFKVVALGRSSGMVLDYDGISIDNCLSSCTDEMWTSISATGGGAEAMDLQKLTTFLDADFTNNRVVIDCTDAQDVAEYYPKWLSRGINVIAANKKAGAGPSELYDACVTHSNLQGAAQWYYETTGPGSGLPVITTLKVMRQSGDRVERVEGVFSGTVTYLINELGKGVPLADALESAADLGIVEPDPSDDLSGLDVRRKVLVLARELGLDLDLSEIPCDSLMPPSLSGWAADKSEGAPPVAKQLADAIRVSGDDAVGERVRAVAEGGENVLIQLACVDVNEKKAWVELVAMPRTDTRARCQSNENIVLITSRRWSSPMVLQGPGAGPQITASGVMADLLGLSRTLVEWTLPQN